MNCKLQCIFTEYSKADGIWLLQTILGAFQKEQQKFVQEKNARRTGEAFQRMFQRMFQTVTCCETIYILYVKRFFSQF